MKYCFLICKSIYIPKVYSIHTIHWDKTEMLKRFPSDKTNDTKKALCFLSRAPTHHNFTFNLWFWSTRFVPLKLCVGFSIFDSVSFLLKFIFLFNKMDGFFTLKQNFFTKFCSQTCYFKVETRSFKIQWYLSWSSPKTDLVTNFLNPQNKVLRTSQG